MNIKAVGLDIGNSWFNFVGCNRAGKPIAHHKFNRGQLMHSSPIYLRVSSAWRHVLVRNTWHVPSNVTVTMCGSSPRSSSRPT
jgi:hypothetical protein